MCFHREWFSELDHSYRKFVSLGDNSTYEMKERGVIKIKMYVDGMWLNSKLEDVLFVPSLRKNLFSTGVCVSKGYVLKFESDNVKISRNNSIMA